MTIKGIDVDIDLKVNIIRTIFLYFYLIAMN